MFAPIQHLILAYSQTLNSDLIAHIFLIDEAVAIHHIPLSFFGASDKLTWWLAKNGMFSVKSAYVTPLSPRVKKFIYPSLESGRDVHI